MKLLGTLAFLAFGLVAASAPASAAVICNGCDYSGTSQYLGTHNPTTGDQSTYVHNDIASGALSDLWVFDIAPAGLASLTAIFNPVAGVSNFAVELFATTAAGNCAAINASCAVAPTLGASLGSNNGGVFFALQNVDLAAGRYAFRITGTVNNVAGFTESYGGNLTVAATPVPEPATLGLLGLGLLAVARRRRTA